MDDHRFDRIVRFVAKASSRRRLSGAVIGTVAGLVGLADGEGKAKPCPRGKKRCGKQCVPKRRCCTSGECQRNLKGGVCRRGKCQCGPGKKPCGGVCISANTCCPDCGAGQVCRSGECCYDTIQALRNAVPEGGPAVIRLCPDTTYSGNIRIGRDVTIIGAGPESSILDGNGGGRVVQVDDGVTVSLVGVQIRGGRQGPGGSGAGVYNVGKLLTLKQCKVFDNTIGLPNGSGGGIINFGGTVILDQSEVTNNGANSGGGIYNMDNGVQRGRLILRNGSRVANNTATQGGGIYNFRGSITLEDTSSVSTNHVSGSGATGGGIFSVGVDTSPGTVFLRGDSRVTGNVGGGILHSGRGGVSYGGTGCVGSNEPYDCEGVSYCQLCDL